MITVREQFNEIYEKYGRPNTDFAQAVMENQCFRDAVKRLDGKDKYVIKEIVDNLTHDPHRLRNFGETSALELLAKLGIWYNGIKR